MRKVVIRAWTLGHCLTLATLAAILSVGPALAASTVLDFEDIAAGTTITTQYV